MQNQMNAAPESERRAGDKGKLTGQSRRRAQNTYGRSGRNSRSKAALATGGGYRHDVVAQQREVGAVDAKRSRRHLWVNNAVFAVCWGALGYPVAAGVE